MMLSWDIFCTVIDNYGDIGVCWRLARQLAAERQEVVRLWVDDLSSFAVLRPDADPAADKQWIEGVEVRHWRGDLADVVPHRVVVEAFGCNLPDGFLAAMAGQRPAPTWINLEYLSAEDWVEGCHGLSGKHPRTGLVRHFFFPGFTGRTGGLLREAGQAARRAAFGETDRHTFLSALGLKQADGLLASLFCYENAALPALLAHWSHASPLTLLVAEGKPRRQVEQWLGQPFAPGDLVRRGQLTLLALPFLNLDDYDRLLWCCDLNFVRGEDSFVRAQWATHPLIWHIYPQDDDAHRVKLDAFLARYRMGLPAAADDAQTAFWHAWNGGMGDAAIAAWNSYRNALPTLQAHAQDWQRAQSSQPDLMSQLVEFIARFDQEPQ